MACHNNCEDNSINGNKLFEPGAARFGNFINYYTFNSVSKRLNVIPSDFISHLQRNTNSILCLDIGCNSGVSDNDIYFVISLLLLKLSKISMSIMVICIQVHTKRCASFTSL